MLNRAGSEGWELVTVTGSGATRTQLAAALAEMEKRDGQYASGGWTPQCASGRWEADCGKPPESARFPHCFDHGLAVEHHHRHLSGHLGANNAASRIEPLIEQPLYGAPM